MSARAINKVIYKVTSLIATVVACLLPTAAISVLTTSWAETNQQKLLWIGSFTIIFAMGLVAFTNQIPKVHVFMAAATYVLHVRIQTLSCGRVKADLLLTLGFPLFLVVFVRD